MKTSQFTEALLVNRLLFQAHPRLVSAGLKVRISGTGERGESIRGNGRPENYGLPSVSHMSRPMWKRRVRGGIKRRRFNHLLLEGCAEFLLTYSRRSLESGYTWAFALQHSNIQIMILTNSVGFCILAVCIQKKSQGPLRSF
jgi:hypothetical protein